MALILDKQQIARCFNKALTSYDQNAYVQQKIHQQLAKLLTKYSSLQFEHVLEIGCGTGGLTKLLHQQCHITHWHLNDLCDTQSYIASILSQQNWQFFVGDAEQISFPQQYDLICSASAIQWFHHPEQFIQKSYLMLKPNGLLLLSTFAPPNLKQIRQLTQIGLNYPDLTQWRHWLQPHFDLLHHNEQAIQLIFPSPLAVLKHLKQTGVNGIHPTYWNKQRLQQFCQNYQKNFGISPQTTQVSLNYHPIFLVAQRKGK